PQPAAAPQPAPANAAESARLQPEQRQLKVGEGTTAGATAPIWVALEKGYFKDYGLDVESAYTNPIAAIQATLAGELQLIDTGCPEVMESRRQGSDIIEIADTVPRSLYLIASRPEITEPRQLVGKTVAVNRLNDVSHLSARFALKEAGLDPDSVTYVQV